MSSRLTKLSIKNFRAIGEEPVQIDLDDIVVLVGPNNVGKSSILKAYEVLMSDGKLEVEDFHHENKENPPEIELNIIVDEEDKPGDEWADEIEGGKFLIKEKWVWNTPGKTADRKGYLVDEKRWANDDDDEKMPWGAKPFAVKHRPQPHRINAFATPEEQTTGILTIIDELIKEKLEKKKGEEGEEAPFTQLKNKIRELQEEVLQEGNHEIEKIEEEISSGIENVFPKHEVKFTTNTEDGIDKSVSFFNSDSTLKMGPEDGYQSKVENQGSGARRTLLWSALKSLAEMGKKTRSTKTKKVKVDDIDKERPQLLLMDEPEICLHPITIREMRNVLYDLPTGGKWQVMITTHSPPFIDFSKDNTTIVKVDISQEEKEVKGTTLYRPSKVQLGENDKENLKYLNQIDPYVAEFFFGGRTIIVEGDTEYTAFNYLKTIYPDEYYDLHIIRARGKATIASLVRILNHFGTQYAVLHDSDTPKTESGRGNPAWGNNRNISEAVSERPEGIKVRLVASIKNFESAYMEEDFKETKPYNAFQNMRENPGSFDNIKNLLDGLLNHEKELPENAVEWNNIDDLEKEVDE